MEVPAASPRQPLAPPSAMTANPYSEDHLVEQPALALLSELGWETCGRSAEQSIALEDCQGHRGLPNQLGRNNGGPLPPSEGRPEQHGRS
jgi:hypothetical protein